MITVMQLIDMRTRFPGDLRVVVRGYEAGADDISPPRLIDLDLACDRRPRCAGRLHWRPSPR